MEIKIFNIKLYIKKEYIILISLSLTMIFVLFVYTSISSQNEIIIYTQNESEIKDSTVAAESSTKMNYSYESADSLSGEEAFISVDNIVNNTNVNPTNKININSAGVSELETLPGIGIVIAGDIVGYRSKYGNYTKIEDIMKVSGIKEKKFSKIREFICVE